MVLSLRAWHSLVDGLSEVKVTAGCGDIVAGTDFLAWLQKCHLNFTMDAPSLSFEREVVRLFTDVCLSPVPNFMCEVESRSGKFRGRSSQAQEVLCERLIT